MARGGKGSIRMGISGIKARDGGEAIFGLPIYAATFFRTAW